MDELPEQKKSFFRRELVYLAVVLIVAIISGVIVILQFTSPTKTLKGADYVENLPKEQVRVGVSSYITGLYPLMELEVDSLTVSSNIFEGLTIIRNGRLIPGLAESWTNPDELAWRIKLRSGVKFHSGEALKASDVKYSIEEAKKNQDWTSNFVAARVDSVEVINDQTVELKTKSPDPTLLHWFIYVGILSEGQVKKDGLDKAVGAGPYKLVSFDKKEVVLEANASYWAGAPKVKRLIYKQFDDDKALAAALKAGQLDMSLLNTDSANEELENEGFQVVTSRLMDINYIGVNLSKDPFKNVKVRKAVWLALDIPNLLKNSSVAGEALSQVATPELIGYNTALPKPKQDLQKAKQLLTEAGLPNGFSFTLDVPLPRKAAAEEIKKQLAKVGMTVKLNVSNDPEEEFARWASGDYSSYTIGYLPDTLDSTDLLETLFHTPTERKGYSNFGVYSDTDLDNMLDEAGNTFNPKERADIIKQTHKKVIEELPIIPLYTRVGFFVMKEDIAFKPAPFGYIFGFEISGRQKATETQ
ncbi:MAG TPA: ABC transporter substrate-binding protein [Candidatus Nanoarchaeia archaeon]